MAIIDCNQTTLDKIYQLFADLSRRGLCVMTPEEFLGNQQFASLPEFIRMTSVVSMELRESGLEGAAWFTLESELAFCIGTKDLRVHFLTPDLLSDPDYSLRRCWLARCLLAAMHDAGVPAEWDGNPVSVIRVIAEKQSGSVSAEQI